MRDEMRMCECGAEHPWGIVRYSEDQVPLYGPRSIPSCENFRPKVEAVPAGIDARELWAQTGDLDAQATLATRLVVARIREMATGVGKYQRMTEQWPEFMGFVVSQITNIRGALVRDETKFAHLVAHTDEVVEAMRNVSQLSEQLRVQNLLAHEILERLEKLEHDREVANPDEPRKQWELDESLRQSAAGSPGEAYIDDSEEEEAGREQPDNDDEPPPEEEPRERKGRL